MSSVDLRPEGAGGPNPWHGSRRSVALTAILAVCLALAYFSLTGGDEEAVAPPVASTSPAGQSAAPPDQRTGLVYLALGDSLSRGVQPDGVRSLKYGYPRLLNKQLATQIKPAPILVEAGCGGATSESLITGGKPCEPDAPIPYANENRNSSQLIWAVRQLEARKDLPTLVTITIGGNDITSCTNTSVAKVKACLAEVIPKLKENWTIIARRLRGAAGRKTVLSFATTYDPILGYVSLNGGENADAAKAFHRVVVRRINPIMRRVFTKYGWKLADVGYAMHENGSIDGPNARAVAAVCTLSWACGNFDVHLNDDGYGLVADVFEAATIDALTAATG